MALAPVFKRVLCFCSLVLAIGCDLEDSNSEDMQAPPKADTPVPGQSAWCDADALFSVPRPLGGEQDEPYWYQLDAQAGADAPTIVVLPGGPGGTSIGGGRPLPEGANLLYTDPRGVGCNQGDAPHPQAFYGTEVFADDVVAVIAAEGLDDYVLYGHSYGTVLATVVAAELRDSGLPQPRAVVLEGTLGAAMPSDDIEYRRLWAELWPTLSSEVQLQLDAEVLPLGRNAGEWGELIAVLMSQRSVAFTRDVLAGLELDGDPSTLEAMFEGFSGPPAWEDEVRMALFRGVACRELADASWFGYELRGTELRPTFDACADQKLDRPFDAGDWQLDVPIVYVQGTQDPATPYESARVHLMSQPHAHRTFVTVAETGHLPLMGAIAESCGLELWDAILDETDIEASLQTCALLLDLQVEVFPAEA